MEEYEEPSNDELIAMMQANEMEDAIDGWDQILELMIVPLSLENYWNAFWANDAPYYIPAFRKD